MSFNSPFFLFFFLPLVLVVWLLAGRRLRNGVLLLASLVFYTWGEPFYLPLILLLVLGNYALGRGLAAAEPASHRARALLWAGWGVNIALLALFKLLVTYWPAIQAGMATWGLVMPELLSGYVRKVLGMPLGLSFLTFQAVAYLVDVSRRRCTAQRSLWRFALYLLLFPRLAAGPIVRYAEIEACLGAQPLRAADMADGARRFIIGLAKKVLIADILARVTDRGVFDQALPNLSAGWAWLVLLSYTLQIFYDFSGYTDMALGLGQIFGWRLPENFNRPYLANGIADFWRRWHMTLSGWFRDYVFYPLERARRGRAGLRQTGNILLVFLLTGLWHGVTLNFVGWGLLHGAAIALESGRFGRWLRRAWAPLRHAYTLAVVLVGWVLFRSNSLGYAGAFLLALTGLGPQQMLTPFSHLPPPGVQVWLALLVGTAGLFPAPDWLARRLAPRQSNLHWALRDAALLGLLFLAVVVLAGSTYQAYIYGDF